MIVLIMGVSGAGKSTIGRLVAEELDATFLEADDYHPPANVAKMRSGIPLTDEDRWPWLDSLAQAIEKHTAQGRTVVVACSALRKAYRDRLLARQHGDRVRVIHLHGSAELIAERLSKRAGHYMPPSLLPTQIATLEAPDDAVVIDISAPPERLVETIVQSLRKAERPKS